MSSVFRPDPAKQPDRRPDPRANPRPLSSYVSLGALALVFSAAVAGVVFGFLASTALGFIILVFCAWGIALSLMMSAGEREGGVAAAVLLASAVLVASLSGLLSLRLGWLSLQASGSVVTVLYVAALIFGGWRRLSSVQLAAAVAVAVVMVVVLVVAPPRGPSPAQEERARWSVSVRALDPEGRPIAGALAHCIASDLSTVGAAPTLGPDAKITDAAGNAGPWEFEETSLAGALCAAGRPESPGFDELPPQTGGGARLFPGQELTIEITLTPRADE